MNLHSKKGDVPITILVIGVFAVCSIAILTFFISDFKISNNFVGLEFMDKINTKNEEYLFYSQNGDVDKLEEYFNWTEEEEIRYFEEEIYKEGFFGKKKELSFYVKSPVPN
jgi:hypothetical protein